MADERLSEWRILAAFVRCDLPGCRCKGDHGAGTFRLNRGQSPRRKASGCTFDFFVEPVGKRIVAAGVQKDERDLCLRLDRTHHIGKCEGLGMNVEFVRKLGVGGDQVVFAAKLHAVTGIVKKRYVVCRYSARKARDLFGQLAAVRVDNDVSIKSLGREEGAERARVARRVWKRTGGFVCRVSNDERQASTAFGCKRISGRDQSECKQG